MREPDWERPLRCCSWAALADGGAVSLGGYLLTVAASCLGAFAIVLLLMSLSALFRSNPPSARGWRDDQFCRLGPHLHLQFLRHQRGAANLRGMGHGGFRQCHAGAPAALRRPALRLAGPALFCKRKRSTRSCSVPTMPATWASARNAPAPCCSSRRGALCAVVTALCGPIAFIGLAAPQVARLVHQTANHHTLLPMSLLWGANMALLALLLGHAVSGGLTLPVNAITPLMGVPVVMMLLTRRGMTAPLKGRVFNIQKKTLRSLSQIIRWQSIHT